MSATSRLRLPAAALLLALGASAAHAAQEPPPAPPAPAQAAPAAEPEAPIEEEVRPAPSFGAGPRVLWRAFTPEALQVARDLDRPVLLFLTNPWNTLGAVMDANTFTDERVIGVIRELFVPIRVDVDRRPDVEERFGTGGYPGVAILLPSGESMYLKTPRGNYMRAGASYMTAEEMYHYLRSISDYFRANRDLMDLRVADIVDRFKRSENKASMPLDSGILEIVAAGVRDQFDRTHGGWGLQPKVPGVQPIFLCWYLTRLRDDAEARMMGLASLRAVWNSPLRDRVDGGVFRIALERDWTNPRYEKLLEVNARLLEAMAEGALVTGEAWLAQAVREQADFLLEVFAHPEGGFKRAQGPGDLRATYFALGKRDRKRAEAPAIEPTRIVSWNAHAASALMRAYLAVGDVRYRDSAEKTLEFMLSRCRSGFRGMAHFYDGRAQMPGLLVDQVATARALLDAHQAEGLQVYLREALELVGSVRGYFRDQDSARFVDRVPDPRLPGAMSRPDRDLVENSELALLLLDLAALTGSQDLAEEARLILQEFADEAEIYGAYGAPLGRAVDRALRSPVRLVVSKAGEPERARRLAHAAAGLRHPWVLVDWLEARLAGSGWGVEEERVLRAEKGAAAVLVGYGRRSAVLRTPEEVRAAMTAFAPEKLPPPAPRTPPAAPPAEGAPDPHSGAPQGGPATPELEQAPAPAPSPTPAPPAPPGGGAR